VDEEDVGRSGVFMERQLHAKAMVLEGPRTTLASVGSANFTVPGWGFAATELHNIAGGGLFSRRDKQRTALGFLIPPTTGHGVVLDGRNVNIVTSSAAAPELVHRPWPAFLTRAELRPNHIERTNLELVLSVDAAVEADRWSIAFDASSVPKIE